MISELLPRMLEATRALRSSGKEGDEEIPLGGHINVERLDPESFRIELSRHPGFEKVMRCLKMCLVSHRATLEVVDLRPHTLNIPPRAIIYIERADKTGFRAVVLVEDGFVSFSSLSS